MSEKIVNVEYSDELKTSYLDYSLSVIVGRSLPELCSGQKIVHQRLLYDMYEQHLKHDRAYTKCAKVVGSTMGCDWKGLALTLLTC